MSLTLPICPFSCSSARRVHLEGASLCPQWWPKLETGLETKLLVCGLVWRLGRRYQHQQNVFQKQVYNWICCSRKDWTQKNNTPRHMMVLIELKLEWMPSQICWSGPRGSQLHLSFSINIAQTTLALKKPLSAWFLIQALCTSTKYLSKTTCCIDTWTAVIDLKRKQKASSLLPQDHWLECHTQPEKIWLGWLRMWYRDVPKRGWGSKGADGTPGRGGGFIDNQWNTCTFTCKIQRCRHDYQSQEQLLHFHFPPVQHLFRTCWPCQLWQCSPFCWGCACACSITWKLSVTSLVLYQHSAARHEQYEKIFQHALSCHGQYRKNWSSSCPFDLIAEFVHYNRYW